MLNFAVLCFLLKAATDGSPLIAFLWFYSHQRGLLSFC